MPDLAACVRAPPALPTQTYNLRTAFVTFNRSEERDACVAGCQRGWVRAWFMKKEQMFRGTHRFYVRAARAPEDYLYENFSFSRIEHFFRWVGCSRGARAG